MFIGVAGGIKDVRHGDVVVASKVKTPRGYMQGYNAQAVCNEQQIVIAAEIDGDSPDFGHSSQ